MKLSNKKLLVSLKQSKTKDVNSVKIAYNKSSFSRGGNCVMVARLSDGNVLVGDTKDRTLEPLRFNGAEWLAFVQGVKNSEFDPS